MLSMQNDIEEKPPSQLRPTLTCRISTTAWSSTVDSYGIVKRLIQDALA
jgi:hypothetical protein